MKKSDKLRIVSAVFTIISLVVLIMGFCATEAIMVDWLIKSYLINFGLSILLRLEALEEDTGFTSKKWFKK